MQELQPRDGDEHKPFAVPRGSARHSGAASGKPGAAGAGGAVYQATAGSVGGEADLLDTGFALREIGPKAIRAWLALQAAAVFFQLLLWREVSAHLSEFEGLVAQECAKERLVHGVCVGPMWNVSSWQDVVLATAGPSNLHSFRFRTTSRPPTFLVVVDPVSSAKAGETPAAAATILAEQEDVRDGHWALEVTRVTPPQVAPQLQHFHSGQAALTFEDLSLEAQDALNTAGGIDWRATLTARGSGKRQTRFVAFIEDATSSHLAEVHASRQCSFGRSWKAFTQQHQGRSHQALSWCRLLLGIFVAVGGAAVYAVHTELAKRGGITGHRFHAVVMAKFLLQDVPQQVCIVLYLLGWYEASGLRCQLCLFHPQHCSEEWAFHAANSVALLFTLVSSMANQLLVRPVLKTIYTEDDICVQYTFRIGGMCVSMLPFTTGLCLASRSLLPAASLIHLLAAVPCGLGWLTVAGLLCVPMMTFCDEDCGDEL